MGYSVNLGMPGPSAPLAVLNGLMNASRIHEVRLPQSGLPCGNFDVLWCDALNQYEAGNITHFAMIHSDTFPKDSYWLDPLIEEIDKAKAALCSVAIGIKDNRGLMSCGIGNPDNWWAPKRRITARELMVLPETFTAADFGYPGEMLLHNNGCWIADLRFPEFRETDAEGNLVASFCFPRKSYRDKATGLWVTEGESEDWYFSRKIHDLGLPTCITRRVRIGHCGQIEYPNWTTWGRYQVDVDTRHLWDPQGVEKRLCERSDIVPEECVPVG